MTTKEELLKRLSEVIPDDAEITYATVTFWNEDGTFNYSTDTDEVT